MKTQKVRSITCVVLSFLMCNLAVAAEPMGTAFTYQGRLLDNNTVADGVYDFQFTLYDAPTQGTQLGYTMIADDLPVADGYFTAELDFGPGPFGENSLWLEISVRDGDATAAYTILLPRQQLTPVPSALYAVASNWLNLKNMPVDFADGVDNVGLTSETDPQVGSNTTGYIPRWNGSALVSGSIRDNGLNVAIGTEPDAAPARMFVLTTSTLIGVYGRVDNPGAVLQVGVYGYAAGNSSWNSIGVRGESTSMLGPNFGVYGSANTPSPGTNFGVYGEAENSGTGGAYAGYFDGYVKVAETLSAHSVKAVTIEATGGVMFPDGSLQTTALQYYQEEEYYLVPPMGVVIGSCPCKDGYVAMGGGWDAIRNETGEHDTNSNVFYNKPFSSGGGWTVGFRNNTLYWYNLTVYAMCLKLR